MEKIMDEILTGKHVAAARGMASYREWVMNVAAAKFEKGEIAYPFTGKKAIGGAVQARVNKGRWIADCPDCGGAEYLDPDDPFFFCLSCGNAGLQGALRRVILPKNREAIEAALLEREVTRMGGKQNIQRALMDKPVLPGLSRGWRPGETVADLRAQKKMAEEAYPHPPFGRLSLRGRGRKLEAEVSDEL